MKVDENILFKKVLVFIPDLREVAQYAETSKREEELEPPKHLDSIE